MCCAKPDLSPPGPKASRASKHSIPTASTISKSGCRKRGRSGRAGSTRWNASCARTTKRTNAKRRKNFLMKNNEQYGKFTGPAEIRIVRTLPGPIERVWEYLTDSEKRSRWFAGGPMEPRQGGKLTLNFRHINLA